MFKPAGKQRHGGDAAPHRHALTSAVRASRRSSIEDIKEWLGGTNQLALAFAELSAPRASLSYAVVPLHQSFSAA
jgi:hypothetical protein